MAVSRVFWDTNLFIYLLEERAHAEQVSLLRRRMIERGDELLTSALTLGELLVKPLETGNEVLGRHYQQAIAEGATILPFDVKAAPRFAQIRQDRSIRAPDAIQLACASSAGVNLFITNDDRLSRKQVPGIDLIQGLDKAVS